MSAVDLALGMAGGQVLYAALKYASGRAWAQWRCWRMDRHRRALDRALRR